MKWSGNAASKITYYETPVTMGPNALLPESEGATWQELEELPHCGHGRPISAATAVKRMIQRQAESREQVGAPEEASMKLSLQLEIYVIIA